jgi:hypothetical protein
MPRTRRIHTLGIWMGLTGGVTPELTEGLPHIQDPYGKLVALQEEMDRLVLERNFHDARKQEATNRINEVLAEGRIVATALQTVLKQHFGSSSEKLVEFGIKPFRGLRRARAAKKKAAAAPKPSSE